MRLFVYGYRRGIPGWALLLALLLAGIDAMSSPTAAERLLKTAELADPAGTQRARLLGLLGFVGLTLAAWRGAELGGLLGGRDRGWIAPRPAGRGRLAGWVLAGSIAAVGGFALVAALGVELGVSGGPGRLLVGTPEGPAVLRIARSPNESRATWRLGRWSDGSELELLVRPLAGEGRSAALSLGQGEETRTFTIGAARRIRIDLPKGGSLTLEHGPDGPPLAIFPSEARITSATPSSRLATWNLALHLILLGTAVTSLAAGLGTRLRSGLAALLTLCVAGLGGPLGLPPGINLGGWFAALTTAGSGLVPMAPSLAAWGWLGLALLLGWLLVVRALTPGSTPGGRGGR